MTMPATLSPMLCESAQEVPEGAEWTMEPKFDGWRAITLVEADGVRLWGGRNGNSYSDKLPYIEAELAACLPPGTAIDGEIIAPAGWGSVQSAMTSNQAHRPGALSPALSYVVFDILQVRGTDIRELPWASRRELLEMIEWQAHVCVAPTGAASKDVHKNFLDLGLEGSVCKRRNSPYRNGRSSSWIKVKLEVTIDAQVIGFKPGEGEFAGLVGALEVQLPDGTETTASGMTRQQREHMTANFDRAYRGQIVEIKHNGVLSSGKVRHPRFVRMRSDKAPEPPRPRQTRAPSSRAWMRNYGAMAAEKAERSLRELRGGYGDAYQRCIDRGGDLAAHIAACEKRCRDLGLTAV